MARGTQRTRRAADDDEEDPDEGEDGGAVTFSAKQRTEISRMVNGAITGHLDRKLKPALQEAMTPITEQMAKLVGGKRATVEQEDDDEDEPPAREVPRNKIRGKAVAGETANERKLREELEDLKRKDAAREQERAKEREQARAKTRDADIRENLTKIGVDPLRMRGAIACIRDAVQFDEKTGDHFYRTKRDGIDDDVDLNVGIKEWGDTEEGKSYRAKTAEPPAGRRTVSVGAVNAIGTRADRKTTDDRAASARQQQTTERKQQAMNKLSGALDALAGGGNIDLAGG